LVSMGDRDMARGMWLPSASASAARGGTMGEARGAVCCNPYHHHACVTRKKGE
jgi:hypothetical protein